MINSLPLIGNKTAMRDYMKTQDTDFVNIKPTHYSESETLLEVFLAFIGMIALLIVGSVLLFLVAPI